MAGTRCRACRRYILGWPHILLLVVVCLSVLVGLLEIFTKI